MVLLALLPSSSALMRQLSLTPQQTSPKGQHHPLSSSSSRVHPSQSRHSQQTSWICQVVAVVFCLHEATTGTKLLASPLFATVMMCVEQNNDDGCLQWSGLDHAGWLRIWKRRPQCYSTHGWSAVWHGLVDVSLAIAVLEPCMVPNKFLLCLDSLDAWDR